MILTIEDDLDIADSICDALELEGYGVAHARDGDQALRWLSRHSASLILLDWMMPLLGGEAVLVALGEDPATRATPVVVLTADVRIVARRGELRVADVLAKPISLSKLFHVVSRFASPSSAQGARLPGGPAHGPAST